MDEAAFNNGLKVFFFILTLPVLPVAINILKDTLQEKDVYEKAEMYVIVFFLLSVDVFTWIICFS